ncbi:MAG: ParB/RepB/Spo0J family partition protein [Deltaproteobacteria bacterium]|nr:ParB/RepB/Spo0J family partition protein [Deltaproteobacteria bacterium]
MIKKTGLGKGLDALLPSGTQEEKEPAIFSCAIEEVKPNPYQPRRVIKNDRIEELASSIKEKGIIQPIIVRRVDSGYELIAGERRWRAAQKAGLKDIPIIVKDVSPAEVLELALIENIQREDLNPLEEAGAYNRLIQEFGLTQEELASRVGKERSTVANFLRLLKLPDYIKENIWAEDLSMGHARVLAGIEDQEGQRMVRDTIIKKDLSVRETEALVRRLKKPHQPAGQRQPDSHTLSLAEEIMRHLGTRVRISRRGKRGKIEIDFYSEEDLARIVDYISGLEQGA